MPVPVPRLAEQVSHPVIKNNHKGDKAANPFANLTRTLPESPIGPPPSFGTREEWIRSLPYWRRTKPRRIWEDDLRPNEQPVEQGFHPGLTFAENASVIKGACAEACLPPVYTMLESLSRPAAETYPMNCSQGDHLVDDMDVNHSSIAMSSRSHENSWSLPPIGTIGDRLNRIDAEPRSQHHALTVGVSSCHHPTYERGAFSPILEDQSPGTASGPDAVSSPLEPITPFGVYVDRVVAEQSIPLINNGFTEFLGDPEHGYHEKQLGHNCSQVVYPTIAETKVQVSASDVIITPSANSDYKKLAEPLSGWMANYVWKVCTTGLSLPSMFSRSLNDTAQYTNNPPGHLAPAVHSLLLSTLLQPSAVFLAMWYIVRLPVYFNAAPLSAEYSKEIYFRHILLGDTSGTFDKLNTGDSVPFRLIVLGCMLANKWLDDHTFSNKTWHTISNVPIHALNQLESLALDIFTYDLSVPSREWSQWLNHVLSYHISLSSPAYPQPISRPSTNPSSIVRKAIEDIIQAPAARTFSSSVPQPVFLGLEERKRQKLEKELVMDADVLEIDLDEDGPLREEYLPRRRVGGAGSFTRSHARMDISTNNAPIDRQFEWDSRPKNDFLPPPAKWSPAGDEPILRDRNRASGHYVAVQATRQNPYPVVNHQHQVQGYHQNWSSVGHYMPSKPQSGFMLDLPTVNTLLPWGYNSFPQPAHSRSQSLSTDHETFQQHHMRSYSQSKFEYRCSDLRMTANELAPPLDTDPRWIGPGQYTYAAPPMLAPVISSNFQSTWLRT